MAIDRRNFLRATLAVAGATFTVAACGGDDPDDADAGADGGDAGLDGGGDGGPDGSDSGGPDADTGGEEVLLDGAALFTLSVASGDPRPSSVVLWTRIELAAGATDAEVALQVATDEAFTQRVELSGGPELAVTAESRFDGCVKVRLDGLDAASTYYYRFVYRDDSGAYASRVGRTRTAPDATADVPVRFAFVSCQDINGRYYNPYKRLVEEELDFVVHLGDYVYETTGDPSFQTTSPGRLVEFTDLEGAIELEEDGEVFYAASSLSNYRELYRIYRGDVWLQRVHERYPMIVIWDDHEFADDCHGDVTTMTAGREDEANPGRRARANQAWFEYMPVDWADPAFEYDASTSAPDGLTIYRDLRFGANVHLVMTDLRLFRADHPVPEDAFPGRVVVEEGALAAQEGTLPEWAEAYIDVDTYAEGAYAEALAAGAAVVGYDESHATGLVAVRYVNRVVEALTASGDTRWTGISDLSELPRGLAFVTLGKASPYSSIGSRYLAVRDPYHAYARARYAASGGASEDMLGATQEAWFLETMRGSDATWKVWGNEFCLVSRVVDTRGFAVPPDFQQAFLLSVEDWDGCPNKRDELLGALSEVEGVVAVTGDIHAFFAGTPWAAGDSSKRIVELVGSSISSATYQRLLVNTAASDPALRDAGAAALALLVNDLLVDPEKASNPHLGYASINQNGFVVVDASADALEATYFATDPANAREDLPAAGIDAEFEQVRFRVPAGSADLYREIDGTFRRWDSDTLAWV